MVASPGYLARFPAIEHPRQLSEHLSITHRAWTERLLSRGEESYRWLLPPNHLTDNLIYARQCAIDGGGITLLPRFLSKDIAPTQLVNVLPQWEVTGNELWLVYADRKLNSPAVARYIEFAIQSEIFREFYR